MQRILVTGGTGFVAGWVIVEALRAGYAVRTTLRDAARAAGLRQAIGRQVEIGDRLDIVVADLTRDAGWVAAMQDCSAVVHVASPLAGLDDAALIATAVEGTERVLAAAQGSGIARVVMTSSTAACTPVLASPRVIDEADWTDPDQPGLAAYRRSKVLAERAAWDFAAAHGLQLTTILPGAIFGPALVGDQTGSVSIIRALLKGQPPLLPRLAFNIVDVRDLAGLHLKALQTPQAVGARYIAMGEALWFADVAAILRKALGKQASKVPCRRLPDWAARLIARINPRMRELLPLLGRTQPFGSDKARRELGFAPRPASETVIDCARSLSL